MNVYAVTNRGRFVPIHDPDHETRSQKTEHQKPKEYIQAVFNRDAYNQIKGQVTLEIPSAEQDVEHAGRDFGDETDHPMFARKKIVFINGWSPEKLATWQGSLPQDGEEWLCEVIKDTMPFNPGRGALIVSLKENITQTRKNSKLYEARKLYGPIADFVEPDQCQAIEEMAVEMMKHKGLLGAIRVFEQKEKQKDADCVRYQAAIAWLREKLEHGIKPGEFEPLGKKDFRCLSCNGVTHVDKTQLKVIKDHGLDHTCEFCGARGRLEIK